MTELRCLKCLHIYGKRLKHVAEVMFRGELSKIISCMNKTTCASDPFPTRILISYLPIIIDVILYIVNLCITTNVFPLPCKSSTVTPLIKKPGLDAEI